MKVVLDTNILISGMLKPFGNPAAILRLILDGALAIAVDERILLEYEEVLSRLKFSISQRDAGMVLKQIIDVAEAVVPQPTRVRLPDPEDMPFLEVALSASADAIVTVNKRHFPARSCRGVLILSPDELISWIAKRQR